jgi:hypothetical protein
MGWVMRRLPYITTFVAPASAKDANLSQTNRIARSLDFYFPLKLIGANHGLHTSGGVQILCLQGCGGG